MRCDKGSPRWPQLLEVRPSQHEGDFCVISGATQGRIPEYTQPGGQHESLSAAVHSLASGGLAVGGEQRQWSKNKGVHCILGGAYA
jgi:hypothetical protein